MHTHHTTKSIRVHLFGFMVVIFRHHDNFFAANSCGVLLYSFELYFFFGMSSTVKYFSDDIQLLNLIKTLMLNMITSTEFFQSFAV